MDSHTDRDRQTDKYALHRQGWQASGFKTDNTAASWYTVDNGL